MNPFKRFEELGGTNPKLFITLAILFSVALVSIIYFFLSPFGGEYNIFYNDSTAILETNEIDVTTVNCLIGDKSMNMDYCYTNFMDEGFGKNTEELTEKWLNFYCDKIEENFWGCGHYRTIRYFGELPELNGVENPICVIKGCYAYIVEHYSKDELNEKERKR